MAGSKRRRRDIALPKMSRGRRVLELAKDVLIAALICSAAVLAVRNQVYTAAGDTGVLSGLGALFGGEPTAAPGNSDWSSPLDAAQPVRLAVTRQAADTVLRYGVQYDAEQTDRDTAALSGFLGEALASARTPEPVSRTQWEAALRTSGIYVDLLGEVPLPVLCRWMGQQESTDLAAGSVRRLVVAAPEGADSAMLYYKNESDGLYYACATSVSCEDYLLPALEGYGDNGARFAFELDPEHYGNLAPETLVLRTAPEPGVYRVAAPLDLNESSARTSLERVFSFYAADYPAAGGWVVREGDTLRVTSGGSVTYEADEDGGEPRYPVGDDIASVVETTRKLAADGLSAWCGKQTNPARLYLSELERTGWESWRVVFRYSLDGALVALGDGRPAAEFTVEGGQISAFRLTLRCYEETGETTTVLRELQAAAALEALEPGSERELMLCYEDDGTAARAGWVTWR